MYKECKTFDVVNPFICQVSILTNAENRFQDPELVVLQNSYPAIVCNLITNGNIYDVYPKYYDTLLFKISFFLNFQASSMYL